MDKARVGFGPSEAVERYPSASQGRVRLSLIDLLFLATFLQTLQNIVPRDTDCSLYSLAVPKRPNITPLSKIWKYICESRERLSHLASVLALCPEENLVVCGVGMSLKQCWCVYWHAWLFSWFLFHLEIKDFFFFFCYPLAPRHSRFQKCKADLWNCGWNKLHYLFSFSIVYCSLGAAPKHALKRSLQQSVWYLWACNFISRNLLFCIKRWA